MAGFRASVELSAKVLASKKFRLKPPKSQQTEEGEWEEVQIFKSVKILGAGTDLAKRTATESLKTRTKSCAGLVNRPSITS